MSELEEVTAFLEKRADIKDKLMEEVYPSLFDWLQRVETVAKTGNISPGIVAMNLSKKIEAIQNNPQFKIQMEAASYQDSMDGSLDPFWSDAQALEYYQRIAGILDKECGCSIQAIFNLLTRQAREEIKAKQKNS